MIKSTTNSNNIHILCSKVVFYRQEFLNYIDHTYLSDIPSFRLLSYNNLGMLLLQRIIMCVDKLLNTMHLKL